MRLDKLASDIPGRAGPARDGGIIERMDEFERGGMRALERGEFVAEKDIGLGYVGV